MTFAGTDYPTIAIAALAGWITGAIWYGIFGKAWLTALGRTKEDMSMKRGTPAFYVPFVIALVANLLMAWALYGVMRHVGSLSVRTGMISGSLVWLGFVVTTMATNNAFSGRKAMLTIIDAGHWLAALLVIGALIGALGG